MVHVNLFFVGYFVTVIVVGALNCVLGPTCNSVSESCLRNLRMESCWN